MTYQLILLALLLAASAFFSGAETALFALTRHELYRFRQDRRPSHRLVAALMERPRKLLLTLMVGNVTVNMFIFAASLALFQQLAGEASAWGPVLGLISPIVVVLFGEILPKGTAIVLRRQVARRTAPLVRLCQMILAPVTLVLNWVFVEPLTRLLIGGAGRRDNVTVEELRELVEMSQESRIIDADENAMLNGVLQLNEIRVRNNMVPRVDVVAFDIHGDAEELRRLMRERHLPKIPVVDGDLDHTRGLIYAKDLFLQPLMPLNKLVRPVGFVPEIITLTQLLHHFRHTRTQIAMVVDEHGGVVGLVTIEDVAEQIVGDLWLPGDIDGTLGWERLDDRHYRVSGRLSVHDWAELFDVRRFDDRVTTLAGLVVAHLGRVPGVGDEVRLGNIRLTVDTLQGRRIEWLRLELIDEEQDAAASAGREEHA